ncbi:MAG: formylglycine-generating enzyme family protein [Proteobacteria bacterium]|nr:formylglycine-generating enzyme family protein [Pseudomonadota bacterium]
MKYIIKLIAVSSALLFPFAAAAQDAAQPAKSLPDGTPIAECLSPIEGMSCIPGGSFVRGSDNDPHKHCDQSSYNKAYMSKEQKEAKNYVNTNPAMTIWMQTYYMDVTEVTNEAYKACIAAGKCEKDGPKYVDFDAPKQPITGLSWYNAKKFCEAQGKHLPTEAEWEKAARGENGDIYPWGNEAASCDNAVVMDSRGRSCGEIKRKGKNPEKGRVLEVCSKGKSRYGLCDMMGNAEEWVADWYTNNWADCGADCTGINPKGPCGGDADKDGKCGKYRHKAVRGGSWYWPAEHATGIHRRSHVPSNDPAHHFGFRCAATQEEMIKLTQK